MGEYIARFSNTDFKIQTVKEHSYNVAQLGKRFGKTLGLENTMEFLGIVHDMGKYGEPFQNYIKGELKKTIDNEKLEDVYVRSGVDHGVAGGYFIVNKIREKSKMDPEFGILLGDMLAVISSYHHGGLPDGQVYSNSKIDDRFEKYKKDHEEEYQEILNIFSKEWDEKYIEQLYDNACDELYAWFIKISTKNNLIQEDNNQRFFLIGLLIKIIYSMLIDADRYDAMNFEKGNTEVIVEDDMYWKNEVDKLEKAIDNFTSDKLSENEININNLRQEISNESLDAAEIKTELFKMTVPTGGGKTLSSLRFALNRASKLNKKRIIYVLPYTTIIEQNAEVVRNVLEPIEILEHHSNVLDENKKEEYELLTERWSESIIFTTMVQFLNTFYGPKTCDLRRLHNLADSIIIFDEVQKVPIKCISMFSEAINFLTLFCNTTTVLCTATQPGLDKVKNSIIGLNDSCEIIKNVDEKFNKMERVKVNYKINGLGMSYVETADYIVSEKSKVKSLLVVVNKVASATTLFDNLKSMELDNIKLFYLSSNLCQAHRRKVIEELKDDLKNKKELICISTQLIEAGVDISFEGGIRSIAGLDSIAQTAGRINRNGEVKCGNCTIIKIRDENLKFLKEIQLGAVHTEEAIRMYEQNIEKFDHSLLSRFSINKYFELYYRDNEINRFMKYPIETPKTTIYELLCEGFNYNCSKNILKYKFETARKKFKVIDEDTVTVIVPYGTEGMQLVEELDNKYLNIDAKIGILKRAKQYSINIREYRLNKIKELYPNILNDELGVYILPNDYYDDVKGFIAEIDDKVLVY